MAATGKDNELSIPGSDVHGNLGLVDVVPVRSGSATRPPAPIGGAAFDLGAISPVVHQDCLQLW